MAAVRVVLRPQMLKGPASALPTRLVAGPKVANMFSLLVFDPLPVISLLVDLPSSVTILTLSVSLKRPRFPTTLLVLAAILVALLQQSLLPLLL